MMNEAEFTTTVIQMAEQLGWLAHHQRPGRMADDRWRSSIQGHKGFPDLVLARDGRAFIWELKANNGRLTREQELWLAALGPEPQTKIGLWRPRDLDEIERILISG